jgi:hypothetical protein
MLGDADNDIAPTFDDGLLGGNDIVYVGTSDPAWDYISFQAVSEPGEQGWSSAALPRGCANPFEWVQLLESHGQVKLAAAVEARYIQDLTVVQAAKALNISASAVSRQIQRAIEFANQAWTERVQKAKEAPILSSGWEDSDDEPGAIELTRDEHNQAIPQGQRPKLMDLLPRIRELAGRHWTLDAIARELHVSVDELESKLLDIYDTYESDELGEDQSDSEPVTAIPGKRDLKNAITRQRIVEAIGEYHHLHGVGPSIRKLMELAGVSSRSGLERHINALLEANRLAVGPGGLEVPDGHIG